MVNPPFIHSTAPYRPWCRVTGREFFADKSSIEGKITDSTTGDLLMAAVDARTGGKTLVGSTNEWDDVEEFYKYLALHLSYQLCQRQGRVDC